MTFTHRLVENPLPYVASIQNYRKLYAFPSGSVMLQGQEILCCQSKNEWTVEIFEMGRACGVGKESLHSLIVCTIDNKHRK